MSDADEILQFEIAHEEKQLLLEILNNVLWRESVKLYIWFWFWFLTNISLHIFNAFLSLLEQKESSGGVP